MNPADRERHGGKGRCWPTQQQELLLRAALKEGKEAIDSWHEWYASVSVDRLDLGSQRLLPLVYRKLQANGATVPNLERLKGMYRYTWYKNQVLLHVMANLLRAFHDAGIETLILKGAALVSHYYEDSGSRPMEDFDVLVRPQQAPGAIVVLRAAGWQPELPAPERFIPFLHAVTFRDADHQECDLHFHVLRECIQAGGDEGFWDAAVPTTIGGVPTRILSPADQLLHVCVHGTWWDDVPLVRWIPDAVAIANAASASGDGIDWRHLITQVRKLRLTLPLRDTLGYLRDSWDVAVPPAVLRSLQETPVSRVERIEHVARMRPPSVLNLALYHWAQNTRLAGKAGIKHQLAQFPAYLCGFWGLERSWQVPSGAMYRLARRMTRTLT